MASLFDIQMRFSGCGIYSEEIENCHGDVRFMVYNTQALITAPAKGVTAGAVDYLIYSTGAAINVTKNQGYFVVQRFLTF